MVHKCKEIAQPSSPQDWSQTDKNAKLGNGRESVSVVEVIFVIVSGAEQVVPAIILILLAFVVALIF